MWFIKAGGTKLLLSTSMPKTARYLPPARAALVERQAGARAAAARLTEVAEAELAAIAHVGESEARLAGALEALEALKDAHERGEQDVQARH